MKRSEVSVAPSRKRRRIVTAIVVAGAIGAAAAVSATIAVGVATTVAVLDLWAQIDRTFAATSR